MAEIQRAPLPVTPPPATSFVTHEQIQQLYMQRINAECPINVWPTSDEEFIEPFVSQAGITLFGYVLYCHNPTSGETSRTVMYFQCAPAPQPGI
jgi:hypothetical protein